MKFNVRYIVFDFIFGGVLVAGALLVASLLGPEAGGILAGAPIRTGAVVFLQYLHGGLDSAVKLTRGVLVAMIANVFFALALYLTLARLGIAGGLIAATVVFVVSALILTNLIP